MTEPRWTLDETISAYEHGEWTPGTDEVLYWLRKQQSDNAAFSARNVELELEIRRVKDQQERLREALTSVKAMTDDREAFVRLGSRAFALASRICDQALRETE